MILGPARTISENIGPRERRRNMSINNQVSLRNVSYMMLGGGAIALALVFAVWGVLGIFI